MIESLDTFKKLNNELIRESYTIYVNNLNLKEMGSWVNLRLKRGMLKNVINH